MAKITHFGALETTEMGTGNLVPFEVIDRFEMSGRVFSLVAEQWDLLQAIEDERLPPVYGFEEQASHLVPLTREDFLQQFAAFCRLHPEASYPPLVTLPSDQDSSGATYEAMELVPLDGDDTSAMISALFDTEDEQHVVLALQHQGPCGATYQLLDFDEDSQRTYLVRLSLTKRRAARSFFQC